MSNPIHQILPDDLYQVLVRLKLLNQKTIRDFQIKRRYQQLRDEGKRPQEALEVILEEYPYLQFDTIHKIVYSVKLPEELRMIIA